MNSLAFPFILPVRDFLWFDVSDTNLTEYWNLRGNMPLSDTGRSIRGSGVFYTNNLQRMLIENNTGWFKKLDSNPYVFICWTIRGMWMIYITFERKGHKFSNTTARALV